MSDKFSFLEHFCLYQNFLYHNQLRRISENVVSLHLHELIHIRKSKVNCLKNVKRFRQIHHCMANNYFIVHLKQVNMKERKGVQ